MKSRSEKTVSEQIKYLLELTKIQEELIMQLKIQVALKQSIIEEMERKRENIVSERLS